MMSHKDPPIFSVLTNISLLRWMSGDRQLSAYANSPGNTIGYHGLLPVIDKYNHFWPTTSLAGVFRFHSSHHPCTSHLICVSSPSTLFMQSRRPGKLSMQKKTWQLKVHWFNCFVFYFIFLGTELVRPEPVRNGKDEFRGPEFRGQKSVVLKKDFPRRRQGQPLVLKGENYLIYLHTLLLLRKDIAFCHQMYHWENNPLINTSL